MPQVSKQPLTPQIQKQINNIFLDSILEVKNRHQAQQLIDDLLTPTERIMIAKRISIAYMLSQGANYRLISSTLKVSLTTIARISYIHKTSTQSFSQIISKLKTSKRLTQFIKQIDFIISGILPPKSQNWSKWQQQRHQNKSPTSSF